MSTSNYSDKDLIDALKEYGHLELEEVRSYGDYYEDLTQDDIDTFWTKVGDIYCERCLTESAGWRICEHCVEDELECGDHWADAPLGDCE